MTMSMRRKVSGIALVTRAEATERRRGRRSTSRRRHEIFSSTGPDRVIGESRDSTLCSIADTELATVVFDDETQVLLDTADLVSMFNPVVVAAAPRKRAGE